MPLSRKIPRTPSRAHPPAVVLGLNPNGLGIVKSLRAAGIPCIGVDRAPADWTNTHTWMSSKTRLCRQKVLLPADATWDDYLGRLLDLGRELDERAPIFPSGDAELELMSEKRHELERCFRFVVPEPDTLDLLLKKGRFYEACAEWAVPAPVTLVHPTEEEFRARAGELAYPLLVKPDIRDAAWQERHGNAKAIECHEASAVLAQLALGRAEGTSLLVQEVVPGADDQLFFSHGYVGRDRRLLGLWTGRKIRQHPLGFGTSTFVESRWTPEVAEYSLSIVRGLGLTGYFSVEFKRDPRDARYKVMEVTPGRTWYPHLLGVALGINLPALWYADLMGDDPPPAATTATENGVRWVDEYRDVIAAAELMQQGALTFGDWLGSYRGVKMWALASLRDPVPLTAVLLRLARSFTNQVILRRG